MSALFNMDDIKLLYQASQIDTDDTNTSRVVPNMEKLFSRLSKDKRGQSAADEESEESEEFHDDESDASDDEEVIAEVEGEESDDLLEDLGEAADKLAQAMADQFFPKQFKVKIQNIRLQNLERRKRDVLVQFQVGVPAEQVQEGGLFDEELAAEEGEEGAEAAEAPPPAPAADDGSRSVTLQVELWDTDMDGGESPPLFKGTVTISAALGVKTAVELDCVGADDAAWKFNFSCAHIYTRPTNPPLIRHLRPEHPLALETLALAFSPRHGGARALSA